MNKSLLISLAAMCHDIGKFVQGCFPVDKEYIKRNEPLFQPVFKGRYTHIHALYTAAFIEFNKDLFPDQLFSKDLGLDNFLNLAAMHHKPETPMQWIITEADRLSSGWDRDEFLQGEEIQIKHFKSTRLVSILEQLDPLNEKKFDSLQDFKYEYGLKPISARNIFPQKRGESNNPKDYDILFENFKKALSSLAHKKENIELWMQHFESIFQKYTFFVPAARTGKVIPDVSLYHHSKTTASIATALYLYHLKTNTLEEKYIKDELLEKFLIIAGDFYGIQKFIFSRAGEEAHHRSKLLRGRSFAVSLFCDLAADYLCREIELSPYSVILNSAGKFYIIAPNIPESIERINSVEEIINNWLIKNTYGETWIGISITKARPKDFEANNFVHLWQKVQNNLQNKKFTRFEPYKYCKVFNLYLDEFNNDLKHPLCPLCGKRPSCKETENDPLLYKKEQGSCCKLCRDHVMLGTNLVKNYRIAIFLDINSKELKDPNKHLVEPIFGRYQVAFVSGKLNEFAKKGTLIKLWEVNLINNEDVPEEVTFMPLNGYVPVYTEEDLHDERLLIGKKTEKKKLELIDAIKEKQPKTLTHISLKSLEKRDNAFFGIDALGILKADVDDLGLLFGAGLPESRFTISRLHAMSLMFNNFFSIYLPYKLKTDSRFDQIYTVFAGGDDLFLIGPWDSILDLCYMLNEEFSQYCCKNENIHLSAGISFTKSNVPVDIMAKTTEENLEQAKEGGKDSICVFGRVVKWSEFKELLEKEKIIKTNMDNKIFSMGMLYRLNEFIQMAEKEKALLKKSKIKITDVHNLKWRALLQYTFSRNIKTDEELKKELIILFVGLIQKHRGDMIIPLWKVLYKSRKYATLK